MVYFVVYRARGLDGVSREYVRQFTNKTEAENFADICASANALIKLSVNVTTIDLRPDAQSGFSAQEYEDYRGAAEYDEFMGCDA